VHPYLPKYCARLIAKYCALLLTDYNILLGVAFLFIAAFLGQHFHSFSTGMIIWVSGFLSTHLFNKYYFKAATIKRLEARSVDPDIK
jgi:hypothetical protein